MDFWAMLRVVARQWYVVIPVFLLSVAGVAVVYLKSPITYQSTSVVLLHVPATGSTAYANGHQPDAVNPLLNSGTNLDITGTVLIQAMRSEDFVERVAVPNDGTTLDVNNGTDNPELLLDGPFVFVTADSPSADEAQELVARTVKEAHGELDRRQASIDAPPSTYVDFTEVVPTSVPEPERGSKLRSAGATLALGLLLTLMSAFAADSLLQRRRQRWSAFEHPEVLPPQEQLLGPVGEMAATTGTGRRG